MYTLYNTHNNNISNSSKAHLNEDEPYSWRSRLSTVLFRLLETCANPHAGIYTTETPESDKLWSF